MRNLGHLSGHRDRDRNVLNSERYKWGGVRHEDLTYPWHDLDDRLKPTDADRRPLRELFDSLDGAPPKTTALKHLRAPRQQGRTRHRVRQGPPRGCFVERTYPASWSRGDEGVNRDAAREFRLL